MAYRVGVIPKKKRRIVQRDATVKGPNGFQIIESCVTCRLVKERIFCDLSRPVLELLDAISSPATYPKDAILFVEGQEARGVFVLCDGRVKLSTNSADGKSIIVHIAEPGEIVGLAGTLSGTPYELTAEALEPIQVNFIPRNAFLQLLSQNGEAALRMAGILSKVYHATLREVRYLGFSRTAAEKLARFLLRASKSQPADNGPFRTTLTLTHEEIGDMIGASRETVSRVFGRFKREQFIDVRGSSVFIKNEPALRRIMGSL